MTKARFLAEREPEWRKFEALLVRSENRRLSKLTGEDVSDFSRLFRQTCSDLATVRSRDWGMDLERYLNNLVTRGHNGFYRSPPGRAQAVIRFLTQTFPVRFRENLGYFLVALILFTVPGGIAGTLIYQDPSQASRFLPNEALARFDQMYAEREGTSGGWQAAMAGFYVKNNVGIAFRCFATGVLFGLGTVYFLIYNSLFIGAIAGYITSQGHASRFYSFTISHGSFELTAIVIAGAAGLILGHGLLHPGPYRRRDAILIRGRVSLELAAGAGCMLLIAAVIEAFWSPSSAPNVAKYIVGSFFWILVALYLGFAGRTRGAS